MSPPSVSSLSPWAADLLPSILRHSDGRPLLSVEQAAAALADLGAAGGSAVALRKLLRASAVPPGALVIVGRRIHIAATGLAAWIAGELKVEPRRAVPRAAEATPVPSKTRRTAPPSMPMARITGAAAADFVLPRGTRVRAFVVRLPGDDRAAPPDVRVLVPRVRRRRCPDRDDAHAAAFVAALDSALLSIDAARRSELDRAVLADVVARTAPAAVPDPAPARKIPPRGTPGGFM